MTQIVASRGGSLADRQEQLGIFAKARQTAPRRFVAKGPTTSPAVDDAIKTWMSAQNIRNTALAIVIGTRLVYAKGYSRSGSIYPVVLPTTLFRQASCAKMFTAYALYRLLQQKRKAMSGPSALSITAMMKQITLQSVLHLTQPNGQPPADPRFNEITLFDLMTSTSGLNQGLMQTVEATASAFGTPLPITPMQLARYGAAQPLTSQPGDPHNVNYGNFHYFLLSQVVQALTGAPSFQAAVDSLVCQPMHMTPMRASRSPIGDQLPVDAPYHLTQPPPSHGGIGELAVWHSIRSAQRPLVPIEYGANPCPWDVDISCGCGAGSAAVVDMARLAASLSTGNANPVLDCATTTEWLTNAAIASATLTGPNPKAVHGYHGFDSVTAGPTGNYPFNGAKGGANWGANTGALPESGAEVQFTTCGYTYVALNGNQGRRAGVTANWLTMLRRIQPPSDWASIDLFPTFGMPSFA